MRVFPVLFLSTVLVGCSPASSTGPSATAAPTSTTVPATTTTTLSAAEARSAFVECLADAGIEIPAEAFDVDGAPRLGTIAASLDTSAAVVQSAVAACSPLLTAAQAADLASDPEVRILVNEQLTAFTRCMHDQGLTDFPEPVSDPTGDAPYPLDQVPFDAPGFEDALAACQDMVGAFGLGNG